MWRTSICWWLCFACMLKQSLAISEGLEIREMSLIKDAILWRGRRSRTRGNSGKPKGCCRIFNMDVRGAKTNNGARIQGDTLCEAYTNRAKCDGLTSKHFLNVEWQKGETCNGFAGADFASFDKYGSLKKMSCRELAAAEERRRGFGECILSMHPGWASQNISRTDSRTCLKRAMSTPHCSDASITTFIDECLVAYTFRPYFPFL